MSRRLTPPGLEVAMFPMALCASDLPPREDFKKDAEKKQQRIRTM